VGETVPPPLTVAMSRPFDDCVLVVLVGEMDIVTTAEYRRRLSGLGTDERRHVVIDIEGLAFVDSSGINALVQSVRSLESRGCTAVLAAPSKAARRVLEMARVADVVRVAETRAVAFERRSDRAASESRFVGDGR
jgi:anti-anti-sigma factor